MEVEFKLDHIAYAVRSTDEAIMSFKFIYPIIKVYKYHEDHQNVYITYLQGQEGHVIEIVEPAEDPNPVKKMLSAKESVLYHICYKVNDFIKAQEHLRNNGYFMITKPFESSNEAGLYASHYFSPYSGVIEIMGRIMHDGYR